MNDRVFTPKGGKRLRNTLALSTVLSALALSPSAKGQSAPEAVQTPSPVASFNVPAQDLDSALTSIADQGGIHIFFPSDLLAGRRSPAISGRMPVEQALSRALTGTGLSWRYREAGTVVVEKRLDTGGAIQLGAVQVQGQDAPRAGTSSHAEIGTLPPAYAGNQVARGAKAGLLGNRDYLDTPFSITSYTEKLIRDEQSTSIAELLTTTDASVRAAIDSGNRYDALTIRGFRVENDEMALNGLYGLVPDYRVGPDPVERIDILKGPGALLNGMPPWGSVGGSVNVVTKRAEDTPLTRLTAEYMSKSWFGGHADVGRRFGADGAFGVRINAAYRDGGTTIDEQSRRNTALSAGFDYRGDRLRLSADVIYQGDHFVAASRGYTPVSGIALPTAPDPRINLAQAFDYANSRSLTAMGRAEFDLAPDVTLFAALGGNHFGYDKREAPGATITDARGDATSTSKYQQGLSHALSAEAGVRAKLSTGPIAHQLVVSGNVLRQTTWFGQTTYANYATNIYVPTRLTGPGTPTSVSPQTKDSGQTLSGIAVADTLSVSDGLVQLTLGLRRQQVETSNYGSSGAVTARYDRGATTPSAALVVRPAQHLSLYANYIEALTPGASPPADSANPNQVFAPYRSKQVELGTKLDLGRFGATLGLFQIDQPSGIVDAVTKIYSLNGQQRNRGLELSGFGELGRQVRIVGGVTLLDAKQRRTQGGLTDGKNAIGVPSVQANLGAEWDTPFIPGFTLTGRVIHTGRTYVSADNLQRVPDWTRFDLGGRYKVDVAHRPVTLRANVTNLFNRSYWWANPSGYLISGMPRTFWLSASVDF
ncbi:TonB-dependent receptor [Novosphingobium terrae]|uniref:TonB-dependent receptor n=1 Tax=Novosphingobium terrae TaxID=2726189 RepID=UPI00197EB8C1|nr:TonB-dependent receptor [Novosphingobium terrae]